MADESVQRRVAAILAPDVVGYSRASDAALREWRENLDCGRPQGLWPSADRRGLDDDRRWASVARGRHHPRTGRRRRQALPITRGPCDRRYLHYSDPRRAAA